MYMYVGQHWSTNRYKYSATPIASAFSPLRQQNDMSSIAVRHQVCHEGQENTQGALRSFLRGRLP